MQNTTGDELKSLSVPKPAPRYQSVDFLRGLTVMSMIIVNTPGTWDYVYKPLQHANWHGCTPTDVIFPCFLVIIGISMWFSFGKYNRRFSLEAGKKIMRRTILMFAIGMLLNKFPVFWKNLDHWHIMGCCNASRWPTVLRQCWYWL
ncbi:MAG: DUF1624 domain-containing protein [Lewinellaceae bacterium]|nr:DUF1624 domain-containing protein [Lewinellaceae bacterium]